MMKKIVSLSLSLAFVFALCLCPFSAQTVNGLYLLTLACPQGYIDYAEEHVSRFVAGTGEDVDLSSVTVGSPFSFAQQGADIYYFPILCDGVITYMLRVYPNGEGGYDAAISTFLAADLEKLSSLTSFETPMYLVMENSAIVAHIGKGSYPLFSYPAEYFSDNAKKTIVARNAQFITVNAKEKSAVSLNYSESRSNQYKFIAIDMVQVQSVNSAWCGAYCAAAILRSVGTATPMGHPTAEDVLSIIYPNGYTTASTTTPAQLIAAAHEYEVYPIFVNSTMSTDFLINQLNDLIY